MDVSTIVVLAFTAITAFFLVYIEVKSRRHSANSAQGSPPETITQPSKGNPRKQTER